MIIIVIIMIITIIIITIAIAIIKDNFFIVSQKSLKFFLFLLKKKSLENLYFIEQSGTDNLYSCTKTEIFKNSFI